MLPVIFYHKLNNRVKKVVWIFFYPKMTYKGWNYIKSTDYSYFFVAPLLLYTVVIYNLKLNWLAHTLVWWRFKFKVFIFDLNLASQFTNLSDKIYVIVLKFLFCTQADFFCGLLETTFSLSAALDKNGKTDFFKK